MLGVVLLCLSTSTGMCVVGSELTVWLDAEVLVRVAGQGFT